MEKAKITDTTINNSECRIQLELGVIFDDIIKRIEKIEAFLDAKKLVDKEINPLDLNRDGVVDKKDASIAGKVLANRRKRK